MSQTDRKGGGTVVEKMDPRKLSTLMKYHQTIEDRVDLDKIWPDLEEHFTQRQKMDINHVKGKERMRVFVDTIAHKDDAAFTALVKSLRRDYRWLSSRFVQGVKEEDMRLKHAGEGVRQRIALALLTTRISERQKEAIIANVSDAIEDELNSKASCVNIPDHRASAELGHINQKVKKMINEELDPLLYGPGHKTVHKEDAGENTAKLESMLVELNVLQDCYSALGVHTFSNSGKALPMMLCQKIEETKASLAILQRERKELVRQKEELAKEKSMQGKDVGYLESRNRTLELKNRTLESDLAKLDQEVKKLTGIKDHLEIEKRKLQDDNSKLSMTTQDLQTETWTLGRKFKMTEELNQKLSRENHKLTSKQMLMGKESYGISPSVMKADQKVLVQDKSRLKAEVGKLESDRRQLLIRSQKLESENDMLRDQKRKLMADKRKFWSENQLLKTEAKRLAIGNTMPSVLPPIPEGNSSKGSLQSSLQSETGSYNSLGRRQPQELKAESYKNPGKGSTSQTTGAHLTKSLNYQTQSDRLMLNQKGGNNIQTRPNKLAPVNNPPTRNPGNFTSRRNPSGGIPGRKTISSSTFTANAVTGSGRPTQKSNPGGNSLPRASHYDYRSVNTAKQSDLHRQPRYGNRA